MTQPKQPAVPALRVVSGSPTPEELAVVTALVAAAAVTAGQQRPARPTLRGTWGDPAHHTRRSLLPGANAWRSSAW